MSDDKRTVRDVDDELKKIKASLIHQLSNTNILFVNLHEYYNRVERLRMERESLLMDEI